MIGERIKVSRIASGLSLRELARKVGVSHQAIFKYENNKDIPSSEVIIALSKALNVKAEYFFRPLKPMDIVPAFRKRSCLSAKVENAVIEQVRESLERRLELEELTTVPHQNHIPDVPNYRNIRSMEQVETVAENIRFTWGLSITPIDNLIVLLEDRGVRILITNTDNSHFDACGFWVETGDEESDLLNIPVIAVRSGVPGDRQRFSVAHELGHLIFDRLFQNESDRVAGAKPVLDAEKVANRFAAAFLVPQKAAINELGIKRKNLSITELLLLKQKYGFSIQAWLFRATDLGIISKNTGVRLFKYLKSRNQHKVEPGMPVPFEYPTKAKQLALRAVAEKVISRSKAADLLGVSLSEFMDKEV